MMAEDIWSEEHGIPSRFELARDLMEMPERIQKAERDLTIAKLSVVAAKDELAQIEGDLLIRTNSDGTPFLTGKNAEQRAAEVRNHTFNERARLRDAEEEADLLAIAFNAEVNRFRALRAVASLIAGENER